MTAPACSDEALERFAGLQAALRCDAIQLVPFEDAHVEDLRIACAADPAVWAIYPVCLTGDHFDPTLAMIRSFERWVLFAVRSGGRMVGMTAFIAPPAGGHVEIGATYLHPDVRGTGCNRTVKQLMIERAFALGFDAVVFRIDTRNARSLRAVEKLGAKTIETRRGDLTTWTGYRRDTAICRLEPADWRAASA